LALSCVFPDAHVAVRRLSIDWRTLRGWRFPSAMPTRQATPWCPDPQLSEPKRQSLSTAPFTHGRGRGQARQEIRATFDLGRRNARSFRLPARDHGQWARRGKAVTGPSGTPCWHSRGWIDMAFSSDSMSLSRFNRGIKRGADFQQLLGAGLVSRTHRYAAFGTRSCITHSKWRRILERDTV